MLSTKLAILFVPIFVFASSSFGESVETFAQRMVKKYNGGKQIETFEPTYLPRHMDMLRDREWFDRHMFLPLLIDLNNEIEKVHFENVLFPEPKSLKDDLVALIYIRIIERSIPPSKMNRGLLGKLLKYKQGLLTPEGKLYLAVIEYVAQDEDSFEEYEPGAVYSFLPLKTLLIYHSKGAREMPYSH